MHGHAFSCVASIPTGTASGFLYAAGSEEKVIRVFEAPRAFLHTLASARGEEQPEPDSMTAVQTVTTTCLRIYMMHDVKLEVVAYSSCCFAVDPHQPNACVE